MQEFFSHTQSTTKGQFKDLVWTGLLKVCHSIQVILGGGRQYMFPKTVQDPEYPSYKGDRNDGQNLVLKWLKNKKVNGRYQMPTFHLTLN